MRGGRDRGGGGGGGGGGGSLTIESLAEPGTLVSAGDVVARLESERTRDFLDNYESNLVQVRRRTASRRASLVVSTESVRQEYRTATGEAAKADLDLGTADVRSAIQAEILDLLAQQGRAVADQLETEVRLGSVAEAAELRTLELDVARAERRLERTMSDLEKMTLRAPVSGLVVAETLSRRDSTSQVSAGDQVNPGSAFLRIVDLTGLSVYATVNQADSQAVRVGRHVAIQLDAFPGEVFDGRVSSIGAIAISSGSSGSGRGSRRGSSGGSQQWVREVPVEIRIDSEDPRIMPDLSARAEILLAAQDDALIVPRAALAQVGGRDTVWVRQGSEFVEREVSTGLWSNTEVTVVSGLAAGEEIAARPLADRDSSRDTGPA